MNIDKDYIIIENKPLWQDDTKITQCFKCKQNFTLYNRKHHCRICGKIYCYTCCNLFISVPDFIDVLNQESHKNVRVCSQCNTNVKKQYINQLLNLFINFDLQIINTLLSVCRAYYIAGIKYIELFKQIQYKLELTQNDKIMLHLNKYYIRGHINQIDNILSSKKISCKNTFCLNLNCHVTINNIIQLIQINSNNDSLTGLITYLLKDVTKQDILNYIPFILNNIHNNNNLFYWLIKFFLNTYELLDLYWYIKSYVNNNYDYITYIRNIIYDHKTNKQIQIAFTRCVSLDTITYEQLSGLVYYKYECYYIPLFPDIKFINIDIKNIIKKQSNTSPMIIPFISDNNKIKKVMYKTEDIRKDHIVLNLINIIKNILLEYNIDIPIVYYKILPTTTTSGYIEIVDNAYTLQEIINKNQSLQNFILNNNNNKIISDVKQTFIKSVSLYCVISYLLGIGDRNLDNIMITTTGILFHIDFSYILGQTPNIIHYNNKKIKITKEIIDAIGGIDSDNYNEFKQLCSTIYNILRKYVNLFKSLLLIISSFDKSLTNEMINKELNDRFEINELNINKNFGLKVEQDIDNLQYMVIDLIYSSKSNSSFYFNKLKSSVYDTLNFYNYK